MYCGECVCVLVNYTECSFVREKHHVDETWRGNVFVVVDKTDHRGMFVLFIKTTLFVNFSA